MTWYRLLCCELKSILTNPAIFLTVFGGLLFYSFLYPQPYLNQFPTEQKIAVIDNDNSAMSRKLLRLIAATPGVDISRQASSLEQAHQMLNRREVFGVLVIPENFYRDIMLHRSPTLAYAADASYFLIYGTVAEGITMAATALDEEIQQKRRYSNRRQPPPPTKLDMQLVFNPNGGYLNYVVPAVFLLILQQILLIATGIHAASLKERAKGGEILYCAEVHPLYLIGIRIAAFILIYTPFILFYLGTCFTIYHIPRLADPIEFIQIIVPFILASITLGTCIGSLLPRKELVTFVVLVSSLPLVFSTGFIWPREMIPHWLNWLVQWSPSTSAITAALRLNQMGALFTDIAEKIISLWGLFFLYLTMALYLLSRQNRENQEIQK